MESTSFLSNVSTLLGSEDENPVNLLIRRMQVPLIGGICGAGIVQASKGVLNSPALFGRMAYITLPVCGIGFYYLAGTYITERIRGKKGAFNHLVGACCTCPLLRKFMPLTPTVGVIFFISLPLYAVVHDFIVRQYRIPLWLSLHFGAQMSSYDVNFWLKNKSSAPFVKRESYDLFTIPSK